MECIIREIREEVGLQVDHSFPPVLTACWNQPSSRDAAVNDIFTCIALKVKSEQFELDNVEIHNARWAPIEEIKEAHEKGTIDFIQNHVHHNDTIYNLLLVKSVVNWLGGRYFGIRNGPCRKYPKDRWLFY